ncbi:DedA family protein [Pantoea sp. Mhis]|uniref:DedA family protein n=1 Tax=Pantoea sp. Mhis TaxID=2576759 RepID=UPI001358FF9B|nr:DedA family protein [Pantoea sp. Mhis]MXP56113.1 DedA family protein [Pantoea sp. Mhis]
MNLYINGLISQYGYLSLLIGCIAEGETFTLLGGVAVHEGLLCFSGVFLASMIGGIIGDQLLFWLGYRFGLQILKYFNKYQKTIKKASLLIRKWPSLFVIGVRFMYGFRIIGPIIIGTSRLKPLRFFILNVIGSALWALIFVTLGYFAGELVMPLFHNLHQYCKPLLWSAILVFFIFIMRYIIRNCNRYNN